MGSFAERLRLLAIGLGAPGLFVIAFIDSSFLSLPEVADLLVVYMVARHKGRMLLYVLCTTAGSLLGCLVVYYLGKKGSDAIGRGRLSGARVEKTVAILQRYGMMAVLVPSILPPPMPFKIFVILAGAAGISTAKFASAILIGRGMRYFVLGLLAERYGDVAMDYMHRNAGTVSMAAAAVLAAAFGLYLWKSKAERPPNR